MVTKFKELSDLWIEEKKNYIKKSTYFAYLNIKISKIDPYFDNINEINPTNLLEFTSKISSSLSSRTVKDIVVVLRMIIKFGVKNGFIDSKLLLFNFPIKLVNVRIQILTKREQKILTDYLKSNFTFINLSILISLYCGLRIGEICALQWSDYNDLERTLNITKTLQRTYNIAQNNTFLSIGSPKTLNSERIVPVPSNIAMMIKSFKRFANKSFYMTTNSSKPLEPRTLRKYFKNVLHDCGLDNFTFHALRHTFATRLVENGSDYKTISAILGHSSVITTMNLYVHPNLDMKRKTVNKMGEKFL